ncbi:hypothetical protein D3C71_1144340 [compost metagenome]
MGLVLHVVEQHQAECHVAHGVEAHQAHGPRHGADGAPARMREMHAVDQAQQLVGERHILEDLVCEIADAVVLGVGHALDARHRVRQRRKVALVAHAPQQEVERGIAGGRGRAGRSGPGTQGIAKLRRRRIALARLARHRTLQNGPQGVVHARPQVFRQHQGFVGNAVQRLPGVLLVDQWPAREQLHQHQGGRIHIHGRCRGRPGRRLGREVRRGATGQLRIRHSLHRRRHAEVHHPRVALGVDHDVGRLEVAVHDPGLVRGLQAIQHIHHQRHCVVRRAAPLLRQMLGQRLAWNVLEHDVGLAALHIGLKHWNDEGVRQAPHMPGFAQPVLQHRRVLVLHGAHELDGHLALQARVQRQPHGGLGAPAQQLFQFKAAQRRGRLVGGSQSPAFGGGKRGKISHGGDQGSGPTAWCPCHASYVSATPFTAVIPLPCRFPPP